MKVKTYQRYVAGELETVQFNEGQARAVGTTLAPDGSLPLEKALELVNKWNAQHVLYTRMQGNKVTLVYFI